MRTLWLMDVEKGCVQLPASPAGLGCLGGEPTVVGHCRNQLAPSCPTHQAQLWGQLLPEPDIEHASCFETWGHLSTLFLPASYDSTPFCHEHLIHSKNTVSMVKCFTACSLSTGRQPTTTLVTTAKLQPGQTEKL